MIVVAIAAAYISAQETESVPEDNLFSLDDDLSEAHTTLQSMQAAGKSEKECRKLVTDTKSEIETNIKNEQKIIDGIPTGKHCDKFMEETEDEKTEAKRTMDEEKKAEEELTKATNTMVVFGKHTFSSLTEGDCSVFFSSSSYLSAKTKHEEATTSHTKAVAAKKQAEETYTKVVEQAQKDTQKCLCDTKSKHAEATKNGHANDEANKKAWAMAHKLECVLDGKTSCTIPPCPTVKAATLTAAVNGADCSAAKKTATALPPTDPCKKWEEERKANLEIAAALKANVGFAPNVLTLNAQGKKTLTEVAKTLNKYPWMAVNVQAHSSAPVGDTCNKLVQGRAESTKAFLAQMGCKNKMTVIKGTCTVKRAITIGGQDTITNAAAAAGAPPGCATGGFVMANAKVRHCPAGKSITSLVDCQKAYDTFNAKGDFKYPAKRGLVAGKWPDVPVDCSIQYADGGAHVYVSTNKDQSPHFNTNRAASGNRATSGEFRLFCKA